MSFRVVVARTAARQLAERLPEAVAGACVEFIFGALAEDPHRVGAPLRRPFHGQWRARRGEYRVRYRIDEHSQTVYVLDVDHRRDAYRS
ncbi:MAG: type II toxin-antitoxin system RelE family toxin [Acidimicrobiales bacterium]